MLSVYTNKGFKPINNRSNFKIIYDYEGGQTLSFDIPTNDEIYSFLYEENKVHYEDNLFKINKINQRKIKSTIEATIYLDEWKTNFYQHFYTTYKLFSEVVNLIIPDGWTIEGAGTVTGRRTINLEGVTSYDVLMQCMSTYNIVFEYHTLEKNIKVIKPDTYQSRGLYITDELNLKELEFKGDSTVFATRLYAFGKKTEETDEEGNVTSTTYVNFASINGGKNYVDNNEYSNKIIVQYWQDDRYTDPESLLNDAIDKLKELAKPVRSYSCQLIDLSRINDKYKYLDFKLYDKVTLLDSVSKVNVQHQIVEYVDYPDNRNNNSVSLSSVFKKITGTIDNIKQSISNIDTELIKKESTINEIIRDVKNNTLKIQDTYTKGEVDKIEESIIQQTSESINLAIQDVEKKIQDIDTSLFTYELHNDGTTIKNDSNVVLSAKVFEKGEDVTDTLQDTSFNWIRKSNDNEGDTEWNNAHKGIKSVTLTPDDVYVSGVFYCQIVMTFGVQRTQSLTVNDETDIADLKNSYLDPSGTGLVQQLDDESYFPDWTETNAVLTPCIVDGLLNIDIGQCSISYKRIENGLELDLGEGETAENGVLTISKNLMNMNKTSLDYVCYIFYKNSTIKLYRSYVLNVIGQAGKDGDDGTGIISQSTYHAVSSSRTVAPTSGWTTADITRAEGQYLWMKIVTKFDNNTETESTPVMISGDTGPQGLQGVQGPQGNQGIQGPKGDDGKDGSDGKTSFFHIKYSSIANPTTSSQMKEEPDIYIGTYVDYTETDSTNPADYTWFRFQGLQGEDGQQGIPGENGIDGTSSYLHIKYSNDGGQTFTSNSGEATGDYIGVCVDNNVSDPTTVSSYKWSKIKGETGPQGLQGLQGPKGDQGIQGPKGDTGAKGDKGDAGQTTYFHIKYSSVASPTSSSQMTETPSTYIGTYVDFTATDSTDPTKYTWYRFQGLQGDQGIPGTNGTNGKTSYLHIKYSNDGGKTFTASSGETVGEYIGTCVDYNSADPTTVGSYTWAKIKGETGATGPKGDKGEDAAVRSATAPTDTSKMWFDTTDNLLKYWNGETWEVTNDYASDLNNVRVQITTEYNSAIEQLKESITSLVEELQTTTTDNSQAVSRLSSQIQQNATSISLVTNSINSITDKISGLATKEEISKWARFVDGVLELGASNSPFAVKLSNTELGFYQNGVRIAYLSNQQLNISQAVVMQKIQFPDFEIVDEVIDGVAHLIIR